MTKAAMVSSLPIVSRALVGYSCVDLSCRFPHFSVGIDDYQKYWLKRYSEVTDVRVSLKQRVADYYVDVLLSVISLTFARVHHAVVPVSDARGAAGRLP